MTGFARLQARVADPTLPPHRRLSCLRSCLEHFAPYGLRSTYMYLTVAAGIPRDLSADPTPLLRAVDELAAARARWLSGIEPVIQHRNRQKAAGIRRLPDASSWCGLWDHVVTFREDPRHRRGLPLMDFVERRLLRIDGVQLPGCSDYGRCGAARSRMAGLGPGHLRPRPDAGPAGLITNQRTSMLHAGAG